MLDILTDKLDVEQIDWWKAIDGELERRVDETPERCIVAGWSMGGQIALRTAASNPDNIAGLFLVSSMSCLLKQGRRPGVSRKTPQRIKIMLKRNRKAYLRAFFTQCLDPIADPGIIRQLLEESDFITMDALLSGLEYMSVTEARLTYEDQLMIVHGRDDSVIPWECSEYINMNTSAHSAVVYIEKAGHLLPVVKPEIVGNLLNEFSEYCIAR